MDVPTVTPIRLVIRTGVAPEVAWSFVTDPVLVEEWFTAASPVGEVGDPYRLDFGEGSVVEGQIVEVEPGRRFAHRWAWLDAEPGQETLVTWIVRPLETGGSEIELLHEGWDEAGADEAIRDDHEAYWSGYLDDLRGLLEEVERS
ncbi:MAG TPA: SRPBCC domain-containing protein [Candidatus Sulfomarinibacteraceae bacterium]|nr:SRPBCC domain-containing protein [Candidatus Sulfomarinibacteraceae bacterium]